MNKETPLYTVAWTQAYKHWSEPTMVPVPEEELDLTLAREVLAKVMAK